ncbi:MAG: sel1 repeat family protein, partial [Oscillospiraceae bacterium]|nr:sel1 repeat family protein [Oscillospiraceae bacterium]
NQLGYHYLFPDDGSGPDYETGKKYYDLSARQNDQDGLFYTGVIYGQGWGTEKDSIKAITYYKKALEQGSARAAYNLAVLYTYGDAEIRQNLDKGLDYFCQAAELGYEGAADLMNDIGVKILNGDGFAQDPVLALTWYKKAADAGSVYACNNLAYLYSHHPVKEIEQDMEQALACYEKAADLGDENARTNMYTTAQNLLEGKDGLKKDPETALLWFEAAANRLHAPSMHMLGLLYSDQQYQTVIDPDLEKAVQWYELAADLGEFASMEKLGALYSNENSEYLNYEKAFQRYAEAADACDPENAKELSLIAAHINNIGVNCSVDAESEAYHPDLAFRAYSKAAELGLKEGVSNLAKAYGIGFGTEKNPDKANSLLDQTGYTGNRDNTFENAAWTRAKT